MMTFKESFDDKEQPDLKKFLIDLGLEGFYNKLMEFCQAEQVLFGGEL